MKRLWLSQPDVAVCIALLLSFALHSTAHSQATKNAAPLIDPFNA